MEKIQKALSKGILRAARADIAFYILPPLMILLTIGTVAQAEMGLYAAHQKYFASFIFFEGPDWLRVPLPGGYTLMGLFTLSLCAKFILDSEWTWRKAGIHISHLGVIILLLGGLLTAITQRESYMVISEGGTSPFMYDYHARELLVAKNDSVIASIPFGIIKPGETFQISTLNLNIKKACINCEIQRREESDQNFGDLTFHDLSAFMALHAKPSEKEPEVNMSGVTFELSGLEDAQGIYIAFEGMPRPITIENGDDIYNIIFGKTQSQLPFSLTLKEFIKDNYPGETKARNFTSEIIVNDGDQQFPYTITMNEPMRYQGYTFYQSSFEENQDRDVTILSVVENRGRLFPYIGTFVIGFGLILHMVLIARRHKGKGQK